MSEIDAESAKPLEEEPMIEEGKEKVGENKTDDEFKSKPMKKKIIDARNESEGKVQFLGSVFGIILESVVGLIALVLVNVIGIAQIAIGSIYINDCTIRPGIPIVLIVSGSIGILQSFSEIINKKIGANSKNKKNQSGFISTSVQIAFRFVNNTLRSLAIGSFIAWCILVYSCYKPEFDNTDSDNYCHPNLYLFAFWLLNIFSMIIIIFCFCCCGFNCDFAIINRKKLEIKVKKDHE